MKRKVKFNELVRIKEDCLLYDGFYNGARGFTLSSGELSVLISLSTNDLHLQSISFGLDDFEKVD